MSNRRVWVEVDFGFGISFYVPYAKPINHDELLRLAMLLYAMPAASRFLN